MAAAYTIPFTAIENSSIARAAHIGLAVLGALVIIKSHVNRKTGQCNPSYNTLAKEAGVDRSTMIRYVKRLKAVNLIDPRLRFRDDGGYAANHYHFSASGEQPTPTTPPAVATAASGDKRNGAEPPPLVAEMPPPGGADTPPPGGNSATSPSGTSATALMNKTKERTREALALPTEKQKTCPHPASEIAVLPADNIILCHHCWGLLDESLRLMTADTSPAAPVTPEHRASAECDPDLSGEPKPEQPPAGNPTKTASETPLRMAWKSPQIGSKEEKTAKKTNPLVLLGKLITGALQGG
jgi:hypothetical protein